MSRVATHLRLPRPITIHIHTHIPMRTTPIFIHGDSIRGRLTWVLDSDMDHDVLADSAAGSGANTGNTVRESPSPRSLAKCGDGDSAPYLCLLVQCVHDAKRFMWIESDYEVNYLV
jgi:hypothetical protein